MRMSDLATKDSNILIISNFQDAESSRIPHYPYSSYYSEKDLFYASQFHLPRFSACRRSAIL